MHNTWLIVRREYLERIRSKAFLIMTMLMPVFMASTILIPAMLSGMKSGGTRRIVLAANNPEVAEAVKQQLIAPQQASDKTPQREAEAGVSKPAEPAPRYAITIDTNATDAERSALRQQITDGKIDGDAVLAAMRGTKWESPRGPMSIDPETRDVVQNEYSPLRPNSPYAASKAASDHLVRAWVHTYGLPAMITNCSNNYGPYQFPEKLIPLMIANALAGKALPVYGDGQQVRDWLYVLDHCRAIGAVLERGRVGETYNVGGGNQRANLEVVTTLCALLDELVPQSKFRPHVQLVKYVTDRPGHDRRYAIDARKLEGELGWRAQESFETGLRKTVEWYLAHQGWIAQVTSGSYRQWMATQYSM